ncbi:MAG: hypothetical protein KKE00_08690 [Proteobacteria bacterium]|nr:hypothetical protein [Pseudomonadota bacterium]
MVRTLFQQRLGSLKRNWTLQFSTLLVVTACYLVVCSSLLLSQNFKKILTVWGEDLQMTVYLSENAESSDIAEVQRKIEENIAKLKAKGILERMGPDKGGAWKING